MTTSVDDLATAVHDALSKWRDADIPGTIEQYSKALVALAGLLYVIGLVVSVRYYASLHVRSLELLRSQYILIGVWYFVVLVFHLCIPTLVLKRYWLRALYLLVGLVIVVQCDHAFSIYIQTLVENAFGKRSYFEFGPAETSVLKENLIAVALSYVFALLSAWGGLWLFVKQKSKWGIAFMAYALWLNFGVFADHVFANMPQTIGGGGPPIVQLQFADSVPEYMKEDFDVSKQLEGRGIPWYYARIVYADEHSIFLKPTYWYSTIRLTFTSFKEIRFRHSLIGISIRSILESRTGESDHRAYHLSRGLRESNYADRSTPACCQHPAASSRPKDPQSLQIQSEQD